MAACVSCPFGKDCLLVKERMCPLNHIGVPQTPSLSKFAHSTLVAHKVSLSDQLHSTRGDRSTRGATRRDRPQRSDSNPNRHENKHDDPSRREGTLDRGDRTADRIRSDRSRPRSRDRDRDSDRDRNRGSQPGKRRSPQDPSRSSESSKSQKSSESHYTARSSSSSSLNANAPEYNPVGTSNAAVPVALSSSAVADPSTIGTQEQIVENPSRSSPAAAASSGSLTDSLPALQRVPAHPAQPAQAPPPPAQVPEQPASSFQHLSSSGSRRGRLRRPVTNEDGTTSYVRPTGGLPPVPERNLVPVNFSSTNAPADPDAAMDDNDDPAATVVID